MIPLVIILTIGAAHGQDSKNNDKQDLLDLSLEELMDTTVDTVVGASKYEQKTTEAPSSITIITADEIRKFGYRTLADMMRSVRGFYVTYDYNYNYIGVRGFARPGDVNTRILMLVDGVRVNENIFGAAYFGGEAVIDIELIERVEIIRGPGSSLYGSNAFFAVINVITREGSEIDGVEIEAQAASHRTAKGRVTYGKEFDDGLEVVISLSEQSSKGQNLYFEEFDSPATNNGIARHGDRQKTQNFFAKLSHGSFMLETGLGVMDKRYPTAPWGTEFNDTRNQTFDRSGFVNLTFEHDFDDATDMTARVFYGRYQYEGDYVYDYSITPVPRIIVNRDESFGTWLGTDLKVSKKLGEKHRLICGAEYIDDRRQDQSNKDLDGIYLIDRRKSHRAGLFIQDEIKVFENLIVNAGVRHDDYSSIGGSTNPRLALIYRPFEETAIKLLYGQAFRAPSAFERYYNDGGETQKSNPDLDPETIRTYEIALEQYLGYGLWGIVSGFRYDIDDLINIENDPADGLDLYRNVDKVRANGLEFELDGRSDNGWRGRASFSFVDTVDEQTHSRLSNSPKHLGQLNLIAPLWETTFFAGFETLYKGSARTLGGQHAKAHYVTNLTLYSIDLLDGLELSASVYNLFDKEYSNPASIEHDQDVLYMDGTSYGIQVAYRF